MAFVSITRLRVRSIRFMPRFLLDTMRTARQARRAGGYIGGALLADRQLAFWTMTAWEDQAAMRRYITAGAHRAAMPRLMAWCDEASVVHWDQADAALPDWAVADRRMRTEGRASKVRHPGPHHADLSFRAPRTASSVPLRPAIR